MPDSPHYPATVCLVLLCLLFTGCDDSERRELENKLSSRREQHRERENELTEERDRALKRVRNLEEENDELQERVEDELSRVEEAEENTDTLKDEKVELEEELSQVNEDLKACRKKRAQEEKQALNNIDPDGLISTLEGAGARFSAEGDYQAAVDVLDVLTDIAPDDPLALYRLAYAHQRLDNHEEAADLYNETINVLEKSDGNTRLRLLPSACNNYGSVLVQMGEYDDAQDWLRRATEESREYAVPYFNLGRLYSVHLDDPGAAIEAFRHHIALGGSRSMSARKTIERLQKDSDSSE